MKGRESGISDEVYWDSFVQPEGFLERLLVTQGCSNKLVEFGCAYGTFRVPAANSPIADV